jgi:hypothetical protein
VDERSCVFEKDGKMPMGRRLDGHHERLRDSAREMM